MPHISQEIDRSYRRTVELLITLSEAKSAPINSTLLQEGVAELYTQLLGLPVPQISIVSGLYELQSWHRWGNPINSLRIESLVHDKVVSPILDQAKLHFNRTQRQQLYDILSDQASQQHADHIRYYLHRQIPHAFSPDSLLSSMAFAELLAEQGSQPIPYHNYLKLLHSGTFQLYCWDRHVVALPHPHIKYNSSLQPHSSTGRAVRWADGSGLYYIHGQHMPEWIYADYQNVGYLSQFVNEQDHRTRTGILTLILEREGIATVKRFLQRAFKRAQFLDIYTE